MTLHQNSTNIFVLQSPQQTHSVGRKGMDNAITEASDSFTYQIMQKILRFLYTSQFNHNYHKNVEIYYQHLAIMLYVNNNAYYEANNLE